MLSNSADIAQRKNALLMTARSLLRSGFSTAANRRCWNSSIDASGPNSGPGSGTENRPPFYRNPDLNNLMWVNIFSDAATPAAWRYSPRSAAPRHSSRNCELPLAGGWVWDFLNLHRRREAESWT